MDYVFGVIDVENILHTEHTVRAATLQVSDRQQSGDVIRHAVSHSSCAPEDG